MADMTLELLFFAEMAEQCSGNRHTMTCCQGTTVDQMLDQLAADWPVISARRDTIAVAVNERYTTGSHVLAHGDTVALIPPVSGG